MDSALGQLQNNLNSLKEVEDKQAAQDKALEKIETRFQHIEGGLEGHGKLLQALSTTQAQQGKLLSSLNTKIDHLTTYTAKIAGEPIPLSAEGQQPLTENSTPNTSQGEPEGMES